MKSLSELKKFDALLRMSRFSTKRKGNDKKRFSKKACRGKVSWQDELQIGLFMVLSFI